MPANDTIVALSTAAGEGAIGIVRLSGPRAVQIASSVFVPEGVLESALSHTIHYGHVCEPQVGEPVDEVLVAVMRGPRTYTREDVVEINCHGGMTPLNRVLEILIAQGARMAEPGEFTRRAFMSGRIDLAQAEATLDLIRAKTRAGERIAMEQLQGRLSGRIHSMRDELMLACARIEAHIDFPEEEMDPESMSGIQGDIKELEARCRKLSATSEEGRIYREGVKVAIVGRPNVGKSSLLNALLEHDRAIVTPMPGTTRDVIEEYLSLRGLPVRIMDTAGIREAHDMAEQEGVRRSLRAIDEADLVLAVLEAGTEMKDEDKEVLDRIKDMPHLIVANKADLSDNVAAEGISVSARTGAGIDALRTAIYQKCIGQGGGASEESVMITNQRHRFALDRAGAKLLAARNALVAGLPLEIAALESRGALDALGEITGAVTTDEILNLIFRDFCIGK